MKSTVEIKVRGYHIDHFGHVNNARYLEFLEEGRWAYSEQHELHDLYRKKGLSHTVVNININYRAGAVLGDMLTIETDLLKRGQASITMKQKIYLAGTDKLLVDAEVTYVLLNSATGRIIPLRKDILECWPALQAIEKQTSES